VTGPAGRTMMKRTMQRLLILAALAGLTAGCVVKETRPLPQLQAVQATDEVASERLLDVGIRVFDAGIPKEVEENPDLADEKRVYPDIRRAEARYFPSQLRDTLAGTAQWGAVRVVPALVDSTDLIVTGKILESNGAELKLAIHAQDSTGRVWLDEDYEGQADTRSYKEGGNLGRDPFENVYVNIANDLLEARRKLTSAQLVEVQRVSELRFASEFAPAAFESYLVKDKKTGLYTATRLPAENDPVLNRVEAIRERDDSMVDAVSDGYASFTEKMDEPYSNWRRYSYDEITAEERLKAQARTRMALGALAVAAAVLVPDSCGSSNCARAVDAARYGAAAGGVMAVMSGMKKREEAKIHTDALKELSNSFEAEAAPLVVDVEGRTLRLTGTADQQYAEWRRLLHELYVDETGFASGAPVADGSGGAPSPGAG
jgi:hypothetical protein